MGEGLKEGSMRDTVVSRDRGLENHLNGPPVIRLVVQRGLVGLRIFCFFVLFFVTLNPRLFEGSHRESHIHCNETTCPILSVVFFTKGPTPYVVKPSLCYTLFVQNVGSPNYVLSNTIVVTYSDPRL